MLNDESGQEEEPDGGFESTRDHAEVGFETAVHPRRYRRRRCGLFGQLSLPRRYPPPRKRRREAHHPERQTLAWTLRYKLGLTGTKLGCDRAECGACTVLIDNVPHYSCSTLTHTVRGAKVLTIEGLASPDGALHPVQQGIIEEQGFQCAFCMSGFIMATVGFLKTNPAPTRSELAHGISGNLCRCQDYDKILTAMMRGAEIMRGLNHA